jgi:hypothetical protein
MRCLRATWQYKARSLPRFHLLRFADYAVWITCIDYGAVPVNKIAEEVLSAVPLCDKFSRRARSGDCSVGISDVERSAVFRAGNGF